MTVSGPICRDLIERGAQQYGERLAVVVDDRELTFSQVDARANRLAQALRQCGASLGDRIALLINNGLDSIPLDFACAKLGLNRVPLNARLSRDEHKLMLQATQCRLLVFGGDLAGRAAELTDLIPGLTAHGLGAALHGGVDLAAMAQREQDVSPTVDLSPDDLLLTLFTSGTTGVLKAAQHTQGSFAAICRNVLLNLFPVQPDERMLHAASLIHASGTFVLPMWVRGACNVVLSGFAPDAYLAAIERHRVTAINLVPTMIGMLLESPAIDRYDLSSLRHIVYGASPMPRPVIERAIIRFGQHRFWQYFGQTEVPLCLAVLRPEDHVGQRLGACGRPAVDVELRLVDQNGADVPAGSAGEILVRAASACRGYFDADELTRASFQQDGWVRTRDVGVFDEHGLLHLRDRTSDMIISGGYNIYPREVEDALLAHDDVLEAAVVGAPDDKWVEAVVAFVVKRAGSVSTEQDLIAHVAGLIASYKKPHAVHQVDALPKTSVGKLDRKALRKNLPTTA